MYVVIPPHVQDSTLALAEFHEISLCPILSRQHGLLVHQPLLPALYRQQICWVWTLSLRSAPWWKCWTDRSQHQPPGNTACYRPPTRFYATDYQPLSSTCQPVLNSHHSPLICATFSKFNNKVVVRGSEKRLAEVKGTKQPLLSLHLHTQLWHFI